MNAYATTKTSLSDLATPDEIVTAINQGILAAIRSNGTDYLGAVDALIALCIYHGACFSSGEIAAWIRTYRPDMTFSARNDIGSRLRSRYRSGMTPYASGRVVQVSRHTTGFSTTPIGQLVYVYAPSALAGQAHPFELTAPTPGAMPDPTNLPDAPVQPDTLVKERSARAPTTRKRTRSAQRRSARRHNVSRPSTATVHGNGRLCVPRAAFEALSRTLSTPLSGGDAVYITRDGDDVTIAAAASPGATPYTLVRRRLRLLFASRSGAAFKPDTRYRIVVTTDGLTIDLSAPL
ncbi:MAG: hypothetical protein P8R54_25425 [Myxococcota bacterium]|nr:hypothetical protein [Myxococcota bacterium]